MRLYTVHCRRTAGDPDRDLVLVKEGFNWPAFLFGGFWALWHRMWVIGVILLVVDAGLDGLPEMLAVNPAAHAVGMAALHAIFGYVANDVRRWALARRGFREISVVTGRDLASAETRFLDEADRLKLGTIA